MNSKGSGRFAPSATGALHAGSLFTALISYLQARKLGLQWVVRIEDTDLERCSSEHTDTILTQLQAHGLESDSVVVLQSNQIPRYLSTAQTLLNNDHAYFCQCTRASINRRAQAYKHLESNVHDDHWCRGLGLTTGSVRFRVNQNPPPLDLLQGETGKPEGADPVLVRANGIVNYLLSAAVDDGSDHITQIVRGIDLMGLSAIQSQIRAALNLANDQVHAHLPVLVNAQSQKLSKQALAPKVDVNLASQNLIEILSLIGIDLTPDHPRALIDQAMSEFDISKLKGLRELKLPIDQ